MQRQKAKKEAQKISKYNQIYKYIQILTKPKQQSELQKRMRFVPTRKPGRVKAFIAQTATDMKRA
jgi:hypothetical protein